MGTRGRQGLASATLAGPSGASLGWLRSRVSLVIHFRPLSGGWGTTSHIRVLLSGREGGSREVFLPVLLLGGLSSQYPLRQSGYFGMPCSATHREEGPEPKPQTAGRLPATQTYPHPHRLFGRKYAKMSSRGNVGGFHSFVCTGLDFPKFSCEVL